MKFLRRLIPYTLVILALVLVFPLIYGCSGDDSSDRFYQLLKFIPSDFDVSGTPIILIDYASYREDYEISITDSDGRPRDISEYFDQVKMDFKLGTWMWGSFITGYGGNYASGTIRDEYVGYNYTYVDAEIQAGLPPNNLVAAIGTYDPQATLDALSCQDKWPSWAVEAYAVEEYHGATIHSWGDGIEFHLNTKLKPPHIDNLGRARPLAVTDKNLFYAFSVDAVKLMIDASQGDAESLADLPEFNAIASELVEMECYAAFIGDPFFTGEPPVFQVDDPDLGLKLKRFIYFGSGIGRDEDGTYMALVLYHENPENAELNVSLIEQRITDTRSAQKNHLWIEMLEISSIKAEGNLLIVRLYPTRTAYNGLWQELFWVHDTLLLHESQ